MPSRHTCPILSIPPSATGAHVEVSLTVGLSGAAEKAEFIARVYDLLGDTLGLLPPVAGVALAEFHPENYGYNGITQLEFRRRAQANPAR